MFQCCWPGGRFSGPVGASVHPQARLERLFTCAGGCSSQSGTGHSASAACSLVAAGAGLGGPSTYSVTSRQKRWWLVSRHFLLKNAMDNFSTCLFVMILLKLKEWVITSKSR